MKSSKSAPVLLPALASVVVLFLLLVELPADQAVATVTEQVLVPNVSRFGVNLGGWSFWGPDQFSSNILKNPGFEGLIDGAIVLPAHSDKTSDSFDDNPAFTARPAGFWDGARFSIRGGAHAGKEGMITRSLQSNDWGLPAFLARPEDAIPDPGDPVALLKDTETELPTQWWYVKEPGTSFLPEPEQRRPGSPGTRSLRIAAGSLPATLASYFDSMSDRGAGKLLPLDGSWELSFWSRLDQGNATLHVSFERQGSAAILSRDIPLTSSWTNNRITFSAYDSGPPGTVALRFQVTGAPYGEVLLDDADLRRAEDAGQPFRHEVVSMLERLHPAYLRDWQGQLADTLRNRTAPAFARKAYRSRPGGEDQTDYGYGLRDFLDLCVRLRAAPWIIVPTVFDDNECAGLGDYLAAQKDLRIFPEILVEFGNENWNPLFRSAGIPDPAAHGQASGRCFAAIRKHAPHAGIRTVMNAQAGYPEGAARYARAGQNHDIVAIAPYFLYSLPAGLPLEQRMAQLFGRDGNVPQIDTTARSLGKELAVYEVNLHTINGDAPPEERSPVVAGMAAGSALARNMLDALSLGVRRQCVYTLTGFDAKLTSRPGTVPLWGLARDLGPTQRLRPTGLALQLLNTVLRGDLMEVRRRGAPDTFVYALRSGREASAVLVSSAPDERRVTVQFPRTPDGIMTLQRLVSRTQTSTNEDAEGVRIETETVPLLDSRVTVTLRPWSMAVLTASGQGESGQGQAGKGQ
jgi:hypothetical protein